MGTGLDATPYTRHRPAAVVAVVFMVPQARSLSIYPSIYATYCPRLLAALSLSLPSLSHTALSSYSSPVTWYSKGLQVLYCGRFLGDPIAVRDRHRLSHFTLTLAYLCATLSRAAHLFNVV